MQRVRDFNVYRIFSNTRVGMHRTGCNFTLQIAMWYQTFQILSLCMFCFKRKTFNFTVATTAVLSGKGNSLASQTMVEVLSMRLYNFIQDNPACTSLSTLLNFKSIYWVFKIQTHSICWKNISYEAQVAQSIAIDVCISLTEEFKKISSKRSNVIIISNTLEKIGDQ